MLGLFELNHFLISFKYADTRSPGEVSVSVQVQQGNSAQDEGPEVASRGEEQEQEHQPVCTGQAHRV